jgi:hypothetical protein
MVGLQQLGTSVAKAAVEGGYRTPTGYKILNEAGTF